MYVPTSFRAADADAVQIIRDYPFATIVTAVDAVPIFSYLPCVVLKLQPALVIGAHFARANAHWKAVEESGATLLFHGPHGYISPRWYTEPPKNVPTWNYAVVHAHATARLTNDSETLEILHELSRVNEGDNSGAWSIERADSRYIASQLKGIVGVHFTVTTLEAKFKLSQNRDVADRSGAVAGLRSTGRAADLELAEMMERITTA